MSGRCLCDELITRPEEPYRLWCVVVCDLEKTNLVNEEAKANLGAIVPRKKIKRQNFYPQIFISFIRRQYDKICLVFTHHKSRNPTVIVRKLHTPKFPDVSFHPFRIIFGNLL